MKVYADLHIHSALSACADDDMTPYNIVAMASIVGLDAIAITDHNIAKNVKPALKHAKDFNIVLVPGMELETLEEVHIVCLFEDYEGLKEFEAEVIEASSNMLNRKDIFGNQLIFDENDNVIEEYERLLTTATNIPIDDVFDLAACYGGIAYPAHVDRESNSVYSQLAFMPGNYPYDFVEVSKNYLSSPYINRRDLNKYSFLKASDAHQLSSIDKSETYLECKELSPKGIIGALKENRIRC